MMAPTISTSNNAPSDGVSVVSDYDDELAAVNDMGREQANEPSNPTDELGVKHENTRVTRSKICVYLVIAIAAASVGLCTYFLMEKEEEKWYQDEFEEFAAELMEVSNLRFHQADLALAGLATDITSYTLATSAGNKSMPFVTLPNFWQRAKRLHELAGVEVIAFAPLVPAQVKKEWEAFAGKEQRWIKQDLENSGMVDVEPGPIPSEIVSYGDTSDFLEAFPIWQISPTPLDAATAPIMTDIYQLKPVREAIVRVVESRHTQITTVFEASFLSFNHSRSSDPHDEDHHDDSADEGRKLERSSLEDLDYDSGVAEESGFEIPDSDHAAFDQHDRNEPRSLFIEPVFDSFHEHAEIVGVVVGLIRWTENFSGILEGDEAKGIHIDLENPCDDAVHTFYIAESGVEYIGTAIQHQEKYMQHVVRDAYNWHGTIRADGDDDRRRHLADVEGNEEEEEHVDSCIFTIAVSLSDEFVETWENNTSVVYTAVVVATFVFTLLVFCFYDLMVQNRQSKVMDTAKRSNEIVSSLFPKEIRDQLMAEGQAGGTKRESTSKRMIEFFDGNDSATDDKASKPIADLFPRTTVMFADMAGFTSWSSAREPQQVFQLLETVYSAFDAMADHRSVFKVETVGDCYVAVSGLPTPCKNHAIVIARFARDCVRKFNHLVKDLEKELGPDTADLKLRVGCHSGPVTAGVIRGQRARFQIFGDVVNTASRIETTGAPNRIHLSEQTAELIKASGREHWVELRKDRVTAKGKGELVTYWLGMKGEDPSSHTSTSTDNELDEASFGSDRIERLVVWTTESLAGLLQQVIEARGTGELGATVRAEISKAEQEFLDSAGDYLSELNDAVWLWDTLESTSKDAEGTSAAAELDCQILLQLRQYVLAIASLYDESNSFHNFEHCCHVINATIRFLSRGVGSDGDGSDDDTGALLKNPLARFAFVFSALIHDVGHQGVPNCTLAKEQSPLLAKYSKSFAEQNSMHIGWTILMTDTYKELRQAIYGSSQELRCFRELVARCVLATDIMDKDLTAKRKDRWARLFSDTNEDKTLDSGEVSTNRSTILIEHLIQAADVAHCMQHWHIYRKWNENLFMEMYTAFQKGRAEKDPSAFWYEGELGFFDYYIIPLATKLFKCGVLQVTNDDILSYARQNRDEWEIKGRAIVDEMQQKALEKIGSRDGKVATVDV